METELGERIATLYQQLDDFISYWRDSHPTIHLYCQEACSACCQLAVHCSLAEAALIAPELDQGRQQALDLYVERLLTACDRLKSLPDYLRHHRRHLGPCPFLGADRSCTIYRQRPFSCRALLATRPPSWCGIDLSELDPLDQKLFQQSLDPQLVAWPTHYLAAPQELARQLEQQLLSSMQQTRGWTVSGNLPLLVWLARRHGLQHCSLDQASALLERFGLLFSPLINLITDTLTESTDVYPPSPARPGHIDCR